MTNKQNTIIKFVIIILLLLTTFTGCTLVQNTNTNSKGNIIPTPNVETTNQNELDNNLEETDSFNLTGTQEMHVCNSRAICHRGNVVFELGDVLTITNDQENEIEITDSSCDIESCYVEDVSGKEWDLVFIKPEL